MKGFYISKGPPYAMGIIESTVHKSLEIDLATELEREAFSLLIYLKSEDHKEGVKAFIDQRNPEFSGR